MNNYLDYGAGILQLLVNLVAFLILIGLFWKFKRMGKRFIAEFLWLIAVAYISLPLLEIITIAEQQPSGFSVFFSTEWLVALATLFAPVLVFLGALIAARFFNPLPVSHYENIESAEKEPWSFDPDTLRLPGKLDFPRGGFPAFRVKEDTMIPHGTIHWTELNTHDAEKAMKFYGETLGWTFDAMPMGGDAPYYMCSSNGETVAGIFTLTGLKYKLVPEHWFTYFAVDDVDARVEKAKAAGGSLMREAMDIPGVGRVAIVKSASGSVSGWITPA